MAVLSVLTGGVMGFFSAIVALVVLNVSWITAIGLWTGVGTMAACVILGIAVWPRKLSPASAEAPLVGKTA